MTVVRLPTRGQWAWDVRGEGRAARISTHVEAGFLNLSVWRHDTCVGTVRLEPGQVASLIRGLTEGLVELADRPPDGPNDVRELESRLARLEERLAAPPWRTVAARALRWGWDAVAVRRRRAVRR